MKRNNIGEKETVLTDYEIAALKKHKLTAWPSLPPVRLDFQDADDSDPMTVPEGGQSAGGSNTDPGEMLSQVLEDCRDAAALAIFEAQGLISGRPASVGGIVAFLRGKENIDARLRSSLADLIDGKLNWKLRYVKRKGAAQLH